MTWIHIDPFSGASGDMLLGALVDAGADLQALSDGLGSLDVDGWSLERSSKTDPRIGGTKVDVVLHEPPHGHPHRHLGDIERIVGGS
ncbi:MAG: LarC family nickel insertion protein, partial [Proteobacteria bacterium]|nr:LarC family nickel insertion protein [Pseudomonadota bacterium]